MLSNPQLQLYMYIMYAQGEDLYVLLMIKICILV
jgi:hypothetical protein